MQWFGDTVMADAVRAPDRRWGFELLFDWDHDGTFDHAYSNLTELLESASRSGQIQSDLPEQVNTITGSSAGDVRLVLSGRRKVGEARGVEIFSPYNQDSPLNGIKIEGTKVRYSRILYTKEGAKKTRQFTGRIRDYRVQQGNSRVTLVLQDNMDLNGAPVTLPLWAVGTASPYFNFFAYVDPAVGRPINGTWVVEEIMRQAGYHTGPKPRQGCISYQTCNGAFFPSYGYGHMADGYNVEKYPHFLSYNNTTPFIDLGPYGVTCARLTSGAHKAYFNSNTYVHVPQHGSGTDLPVNLVWSGWVHFRTSAGASFYNVTSTYWLDNAPGIDGGGSGFYGRFQVQCYEDGDIRATVTEGFLADQFNYRTWYHNWLRTNAQLPDGPHYISVMAKFRNNDITFELWIDGVNVGAPNNGQDAISGFGFRHGTSDPNRIDNPISFTTNIPVQHCQWSFGYSTTFPAYTAGEQFPPLNDDGLPMAIVYQSGLEIAWIPDIEDGDAWALLKEIADAEFGAVFINEYGQPVFMSHWRLRYVTEQNYEDAIPISDDHISDFVMAPSMDQYRNTISISWTFRYSQEAIVWRNQNARDLSIAAGQTSPLVEFPLKDVIAIDQIVHVIDFIAPAEQDIPIWKTQAAAVQFLNPDLEGEGWVVAVGPRKSQRAFGLIWGAGTSPYDLYIGAFKGANQPGFLIAGRQYSESQIIRKQVKDTAAVTANGGKVRIVTVGDNKWRQTEATVNRLSLELLADTITPAPAVEDVEIVGDPRIQYTDVLALSNKRGVTGKVFAQVLGRGFEDSVNGGVKDRLALRLIRTPNNWILGDPDLSILGDTTVL